MGKRYSKNYSNYILKKKYQYSTKGTIWERDWVTIGAQHQIEKGKRPFFGDSGFLFTDNSFVSTNKRHEFGKVVAEWLYDDVKNATSLVNTVKVNYNSNDLRDFAYYGSCVELVRSSVLNIISTFPGCAWHTERTVKLGNKEYNIVANPFNIDFATEGLNADSVSNPLRFMSLSYNNYEIVCDKSGEKFGYVILGYGVKRRDQSAIDQDVKNCVPIYEIAQVDTVLAETDTNESITPFTITFKVLNANGNTVICENETTHPFIEIRATESTINDYFEGLEGFERLLLRRDTKPFYTNVFLKMFETDNGLRYAYRTYTWPRINDYCIDIESPTYISFLNSLIETSSEFDEMWCDNLWRNMTHESLRNYDWTYTKTFVPGDEEDNIDGGNRLEKLLRIYGRVFDDLKRYVDGIKLTASVTYNGYNNMPDAELSDRLYYGGWDIYTTIPYFFGDEDIDYSTVTINEGDIAPSRWFTGANPEYVSSAVNDIDFLRCLALSSKHLEMAKGTVNGVDMMMALFGIGSDSSDVIDELTRQLNELQREWQIVDDDINATNALINTMEEGDERDELIAYRNKRIARQSYIVTKIGELESKAQRTGDDINYRVTERYFVTKPLIRIAEKKKRLANLVHYDNQSWFYDDPYEGVPFGDIELNGKQFIVPYYTCDKYYKGEFTFQSNGGWYKKSLDPKNLNDYEETLSYLSVVPDFSGLLYVNTYSLDKVGENAMVPPSNVYYVVNPSDYLTYNENPPVNMTHYFYIEDIYNPQSPDSWKPILRDYVDTSDVISEADYNNLSDEEKVNYVAYEGGSYAKIYHGTDGLYERAQYLDSIISSNTGNNPHVGYGRYDLGQEYKSYMENPFKYYIDNYVLPDDVREEMSEFGFNIDEYETTNKVKDICNTYLYENGYATRISQSEYDAIEDPAEKALWSYEIAGFDEDGNEVYEYVKSISESDYESLPQSEKSSYYQTMIKRQSTNQYRDKEDQDTDLPLDPSLTIDTTQDASEYYLNSKVIKFEFFNTNELFKKYFLDVIGKYLMQVIPSTAITVFLFDCDNE